MERQEINSRIKLLNRSLFNTQYTIMGMANSSLIMRDNFSEETVYVHRRVANEILHSEETIPCTVLKRQYRGTETKWLAAMFTI